MFKARTKLRAWLRQETLGGTWFSVHTCSGYASERSATSATTSTTRSTPAQRGPCTEQSVSAAASWPDGGADFSEVSPGGRRSLGDRARRQRTWAPDREPMSGRLRSRQWRSAGGEAEPARATRARRPWLPRGGRRPRLATAGACDGPRRSAVKTAPATRRPRQAVEAELAQAAPALRESDQRAGADRQRGKGRSTRRTAATLQENMGWLTRRSREPPP